MGVATGIHTGSTAIGLTGWALANPTGAGLTRWTGNTTEAAVVVVIAQISAGATAAAGRSPGAASATGAAIVGVVAQISAGATTAAGRGSGAASATGAAVLNIRSRVNAGSAAGYLTGRALQLTLSAGAELTCRAGVAAGATVVVTGSGVDADAVASGLT